MKRESTTRPTRSPVVTIGAVFAVSLFFAAGGVSAVGPDDDDWEYHQLTTLASTIELGFLFNRDGEYKFGDFTGLTDDDDWNVLGNVDIRRRTPFDAEQAHYYRIRGLNLGLSSRYVDAEYQQPGRFGLSFLFNEIPRYLTDTAETPFIGAGSKNVTLPPGWIPGDNPTPAEMPLLESSLGGISIDTTRKIFGGGGSLVLPGNFDFEANYTHEKKEGERLSAAMFGLNGGNPRSIVVPEPIDYVTHQIDSKLRYTTEDLQMQLQYYASGFYNENRKLTFENPYTAGTSDPDSGYPALGQKAQMPDNWFHQIVGSGGIALPANSRLMLNGAFGWGRQDENYLPFTINPLLADPIGLPRKDLDGRIYTRQVTARFVTAPIKNTEMKVAYRWNQRENDSPRDTYFRIRADSEDQNTSLDPGDDPTARVNRPYSFESHKVEVDLSYKLPRRTKLTLMYDWERTARDYQEVKHTNDHSFGAKVLTRLNRYVSAGARYERSYRNGSDYNCVRPLITGEPVGVLTDPGCDPGQEWENQPGLRKYYMAKLRRNDLHSWVSITPLENLSLRGDMRYSYDDYYDSEFGLQSNRILSPGVDVFYAPLEHVNFHAFYNYEKTRSKLKSVQFLGFLPGTSFNPDNNWSNRDKDIFHTVGAGVDFDVVPDLFSIGLQYLFAKSTGETHTTVNAGLTPGLSFPDYETKLHDISVQGNLQITRHLSMRMGYLWEKFNSDDWAFDKVCPACLDFSTDSAVIGSGQHAPDYKAHVVSWSMIYKFW